MILATGHISHEEAYKLVPEAAKEGVKKIVITQRKLPNYFYYSVEDQKMFVSYGATWALLHYIMEDRKGWFWYLIAEMIREVGAENCII